MYVVLDGGVVILLRVGYCPEAVPARLGKCVFGITFAYALGAGLLSGREQLGRRLSLSILAGLGLAGWGVVLLMQTPYLEPLPESAGPTGMGLLVIAAFGAGLISGWQ